MRVVITGGAGFLGQSLARSLVRRGALLTHRHDGEQSTAKIQSIVLADVHRPELLDGAGGVATSVAVGDVADRAFCDALVGDGAGPLSVFHLGAVMSGQGEADFDLDGEVSDATRATPHTTYGMTKACGELLLADYSRKGFVDGRGVRLPSVVVRAGAPNAATTGVYSGVVRETLAGVDTASPIAGGVKHAVAGARSAVASLVAAHDAPAATADAVLGYDRTVFLRSTAVSIDELVAAVERLFAKLPRCDLLFNNAGVNVPPTSVEDMSLDAWRYVVGTNVDAAFHATIPASLFARAELDDAFHAAARVVRVHGVEARGLGLTKSLALDGRAHGIACGQIDYGNVVSPLSAAMATGMPQADGSDRPEPRMGTDDAADAVFYMAQLPLSANVLNMTVMATNMPLVGRG
ncbi:GDP-mannose 4,6 dehydratase [Aureococcus anophagefferens]|nr:GDP-mannose 4,6 dehydratase [Aureococcus anophagefferens]